MEWHKVTNDSPDVGVSVFAYHPMLGRFLAYKERIGDTDFAVWCDWGGDKGIMPPTHWMPLPPPPHQDNSEE